MAIKQYLSKIFQPIINIPKSTKINSLEITSKSQRLMLELGIIRQANPGCFHFLPLGLKALSKLIKIVDDEMLKIGGQRVLFPGLINTKLWKQSGRNEVAGAEVFRVKDRHNHEYIMAPTHEEMASELLSSLAPISYKHFPLRLYQISSKFRDEMKPRFGLMRAREFLMKDMYSFDISVDKAKQTYEEVCDSYNNIFNIIGVDFVKVLGDNGVIGGTLSHEYQFKTQIGEDTLLNCPVCHFSANIETYNMENCPKCKHNVKLDCQSGIEVGHTFFLGDRYTKPLKSHFISRETKSEILHMGSYGLGLSRILAGCIEVVSTETEINWPDVLAPYNVIILPPKDGSKEAHKQYIADTVYDELEKQIVYLKNNVMIDDRTTLTIGRRLLDAKRVGYRYIIIINEKSFQTIPLYEFHDTKKKNTLYLTNDQIIIYIKENTQFYDCYD